MLDEQEELNFIYEVQKRLFFHDYKEESKRNTHKEYIKLYWMKF